MKRLLLLAFILAGCNGTSATASTPGGLGLIGSPPATAKPLPTVAIAADPPETAGDLGVTVTKRTTAAARNTTASVTIKTTKGAECGIDVQYKSGSSTATGLEAKTANSKGVITWKWLVGRRTTKGRVPISIICTLGDRVGTVDTSFKVS